MKLFALVILMTLAIGCGGDDSDSDSSDAASVEGDWWYWNAEQGCGLGINIVGSEYSSRFICPTSSTAGVAELESGTFVISGNQATATPKQRTCPTVGSTETYTYTVTDKTLSLRTDSAVIILDKNDDSSDDNESSAAAVTFGCFDTGTFVEHPMTP